MTLRVFRHKDYSVLTSCVTASQFDHSFGGAFDELAIRVSTSRKSFSWLQRLVTKYLGKAPWFARVDLPRCHLLYIALICVTNVWEFRFQIALGCL